MNVLVTLQTISYGTPSLTLSANITFIGNTAPTGNVTFQVDTGNLGGPASCTVSGSTRTCSLSYATASLSPGTHTIKAMAAADTNFDPATGSNTLTVNDTLGSLQVSGIPTTVSPGVAQTLTVRLVGASGATFTAFTGTVTLTSTDPAANLSPATYTFAASDAGVHTFTVTFNTGGTYSVTATIGTVTASETGIRVAEYIWTVSNTGATGRGTESGGALASSGDGQTSTQFGGLAFDGIGQSYSVVSTSNGVVRTSNLDGKRGNVDWWRPERSSLARSRRFWIGRLLDDDRGVDLGGRSLSGER